MVRSIQTYTKLKILRTPTYPPACSVKVCGLPDVSPPENLTVKVGQTASFLCVVDMTCMVSYVEWYRHSHNGQYTQSNGKPVERGAGGEQKQQNNVNVGR